MTDDRKSEQKPSDEEAALDEDERPTQVAIFPEGPARRVVGARGRNGEGGVERESQAAEAEPRDAEIAEATMNLAEGAGSEGAVADETRALASASAGSDDVADAAVAEAPPIGAAEQNDRETPVSGETESHGAAEAESVDLRTAAREGSDIEDAVTTLIAREERMARPEAVEAGAGEQKDVEAVTRFIAEPPSPTIHPELKLAAPRRSLTALQLVDADDAGEAPEQLEMAVPPTLPPSARERGEDLPSMMLGAPISTRGDTTQRVTTIPKTHPLANSIAPGGSLVSTPPAPVKRRSRGYAIAAAVALLGLAAGTSRLLESRGEHHAASGLPHQAPSAEPPSEARSVAPPAEDPAPLGNTPSGEPAHSAPEQQGQESAATAFATADKTRENAARAADREAMRVALGHVQMRPRAEKTDRFRFDDGSKPAGTQQEPERAALIAAMNRLSEPLRRCVGDEHGIADVTLTVRAPGVVSHALVEGKFAGSEKGSCIARTLRSAKLPRLAQPMVRIEYPFQL